jgi:hypothetical protein
LQLDYTVSRGLVIIATSLTGVTAVLERSRSLSSDPVYRATVPDRPHAVTSLVFLDLRQLLRLGEQTGLLRSARYQALRPDLEKVRAVSLESTSGETDSTAELFLQIP